jgi:bleomycin hydrolase
MRYIIALLFGVFFTAANARTLNVVDSVKNNLYGFKDIKSLAVTSVKDQASSGTCWCYSGISFIESELLLAGKDTVGLSEMWIVRNAYYEKAIKYVRMHGAINFDEGGGSTDVFDMIKKYGIVPRDVYPGLNYGTNTNKHAELSAILKAYLQTVVSNPNKNKPLPGLRNIIILSIH